MLIEAKEVYVKNRRNSYLYVIMYKKTTGRNCDDYKNY